MAILRAQVSIAGTSGLPEDVTVNTWHFESTAPYDTATGQDIATRLGVFYQAIDEDLSNTLDPASGVVKLYDMADLMPRAPKDTFPLGLLTVSSSSEPREVALCLSFQAVKISGVAQARRRGRVFIGPLKDQANVQANDVRPSTAMRSRFTTAAAALRDGLGFGTKWVVRSATSGAVATVTNGWVDDAFDTQRRRGSGPTTRTVF
jgi:hypothetical protein